MAYYLSEERNEDTVGSYRRYQKYLREHEKDFPPGAFALGTAEWWQWPGDPRCPHDARLETFSISELGGPERNGRVTTIWIRLMGASLIELFYPQVFSFELSTPTSLQGLGDWLYDEFTLGPAGHVRHE